MLCRYRDTPVPPTGYLGANLLVYLGLAQAGSIILIAAGQLLFNLRLGGDWLNVLMGYSLSCVAFFSAGFLIASLAPTARIAEATGMILSLPLMFLSGGSFPLVLMHEMVQRVSNPLPLTFVVRLSRDCGLGEPGVTC